MTLSLLAIALVYIVRGMRDGGQNLSKSSRIGLEEVLYGGWSSNTFNGSWDTNGNIIYKKGRVSRRDIYIIKRVSKLILYCYSF